MNTKHLKAKILDLAIRGKLVPQDSSEGNAADLLKKIRDEKGGESLPLAAAGKPSSATPSAGLVAARNARSKNASFIIKADDGRHYEQFADGTLKDIEDEIPFEIPENWCWCRLKNITDKLVDGDHNPPPGIKEKTQFFMASSQNINNNGLVKLSDVRYFDKETFEIEHKRTEATEGDIFFTSVGTLGRSCIYQGGLNICFQRSVSILHTLIFNKYLKYYFDSNYYQQYVLDHATGTAQLGFYLNEMSESLIVVPPLSEQQRIVSAIEKAFEQIDIIEKNKLNLKTYIKQTKSKVLDLAIHGKLVEQNPQEGNAFELLEKIRNEKAELIKQKRLKEDKSASFIIKADDGRHYEQFANGTLKDIEDDIPFEIPENWCWCRFNELFRVINGDRGKNYPAKSTLSHSGIPFISALNLKKNTVNKDDDLLCLSQTQYDKLGNGKLEKEDMVLCIRGSVGKHGIFPFEKGAIASSLVIIREYTDNKQFPKLLDFYLKSPLFYNEIKRFDNGTAQPNLAAESLCQFYFPLPPLSEQQRIVAKIEQIFAQLDALEKSLGE